MARLEFFGRVRDRKFSCKGSPVLVLLFALVLLLQLVTSACQALSIPRHEQVDQNDQLNKEHSELSSESLRDTDDTKPVRSSFLNRLRQEISSLHLQPLPRDNSDDNNNKNNNELETRTESNDQSNESIDYSDDIVNSKNNHTNKDSKNSQDGSTLAQKEDRENPLASFLPSLAHNSVSFFDSPSDLRLRQKRQTAQGMTLSIPNLQTLTHNLQNRAVCRWVYTTNVDPTRQPAELPEANCTNQSVVGSANVCQAVIYLMPVKRQSVANGPWTDDFAVLRIGCTLATPVSNP